MWNNWHDSLIHWCCILSRNLLDSLHGLEFERNDKTFSHLCHHVCCPLEALLCAWPCLSVKIAVAIVQVGGEIFTKQLKITKPCQHHDYHSDFSFLSLGWERCPGMLSKALLIWPWFFSHTDAENRLPSAEVYQGAVRGAGVPPDILKGEYPDKRPSFYLLKKGMGSSF